MSKKSKKVMCEQTFPKGEYEFSSRFDFEKCGMVKSTSKNLVYTGVVHVKEGSTNLVTIRDKILQVNCRLYRSIQSSEQSISVSMNVADNNRTGIELNDEALKQNTRKPRFSLRILSSNSSETESVRIGEYGWIELNVRDAIDDFTVTNLIAKDLNSSKSIRLIDEDGCVIRKDLIHGIDKSTNSIKFRVNFSGFPRETEVVYTAIVETCNVGCMPKCNNDLLINPSESSNNEPATTPLSLDLPRHRMVRRAVGNEPRHLNLENDKYEVRGHRLILLNTSRKERVSQDDIDNGDVLIVQKSATLSSSFRHCFIDDITCLFTIILASIQLFLLMSCIVIMYCYFKQYRQIQELNAPQNHHVEYYTYGESRDKQLSETTSIEDSESS